MTKIEANKLRHGPPICEIGKRIISEDAKRRQKKSRKEKLTKGLKRKGKESD